MLRCESSGYGAEFSMGLFNTDAWFQPRLDPHGVRLSLMHEFQMAQMPEWREHIVVDVVASVEIKPGRQHTHDGPWFTVVCDRFADGIGRTAEVPLPKPVADHNHGWCAWSALCFSKGAAQHWLDSKR